MLDKKGFRTLSIVIDTLAMAVSTVIALLIVTLLEMTEKLKLVG